MPRRQRSRTWSLPYDTPKPVDAARRRQVAILRGVAYAIFAAVLIIPCVQFQVQTNRNIRRAAEFDRRYGNRTPAVAAGGGPKRPSPHKGAIGRWSKAVRQLWAGCNIYITREEALAKEPPLSDRPREQQAWLHPNMPFTVILLSPFAYLPPQVTAVCWSLLKLAALIATILMLAALARHRDMRIPDWVLALGLVWSLAMITDDILHGNTNVFVLAAIVFHLWAYRRGSDYFSGVILALGICLKMTPAIFLLYWGYQRNWKLLAGAVVGLVVMGIFIPAAALGPAHYADLTETWLDNLIVPGLVRGEWYPIHINQSISGVFSRYFLPEGEPGGNIYWNPDDNPYEIQEEGGWITLAAMSPFTAKLLVRGAQLAVLALGGWVIGWRRLPRGDGRRLLHYGIVVSAMLLLNQRTWGHHAAVTLIATVAIWEGIAFGRIAPPVRFSALMLTLASGAILWASTSGCVEFVAKTFGSTKDDAAAFADLVKAYGPMFYHLLMLLGISVMLSVALRKCEPPYAEERQKLFA